MSIVCGFFGWLLVVQLFYWPLGIINTPDDLGALVYWFFLCIPLPFTVISILVVLNKKKYYLATGISSAVIINGLLTIVLSFYHGYDLGTVLIIILSLIPCYFFL